MITKMLQEYALQLFENQKIESFIGYEIGPRGITRPVFIRNGSAVNKLEFNQGCSHNLTGYLRQHLSQTTGRVAVLVKPCDSKAINVLLAENRIERERIHVIGVACSGVAIDQQAFGEKAALLQDRCLGCDLQEPVVFDYMIGGGIAQKEREGQSKPHHDLAWLESATAQERMEYWIRQFDRCIRCYACRQVCPVCDCPTCLFERDDSLWVGAAAGVPEKRTFHLGRAFHLAGRCVGCQECERVCPMEIPISMFTQVLSEELEEQYQHRAGFFPVVSPITTILRVED